MKFFRVSTLLALILSAASGFMLFSTAQKVQQTDSDLRRMQMKVSQEEQTIRVLRAEWDYLNRPDRLESLVKNNLDLIPATPESVRADTSELPKPFAPIIPARKPSSSPVAKAIPAVLESQSPELQSLETSPQALPKPAAPQTPEKPSETPQKDFNKLLNELSPAGGGE